MQPPGTRFASWMTRSKNHSENDSGSFSARACYVLHAFYTLYTAVLVFLTQRVAMSRVLEHRLKLTTIHDISSAWAGLGSALSGLCKQTRIPASLWAIIAVTIYLVCISVLHVTSSTLLQFQTFNSSITTNISTTLGWVDISGEYGLASQYEVENWGAITASLPVINQFPGLVSAGISNNTVYDTLQTSSVVGHATHSKCSYGDGNAVLMAASPPWSDQIQILQSTGAVAGGEDFAQAAVLVMVSTLLEIEPSVQQEVAVPMVWESPFMSKSYDVYFMQCSLSTSNTTVVIDTQNNALVNPMPVPQPSTQWEEMLSWTSTIWSAYAVAGINFKVASGYTSEPSIVDEFRPYLHCHATTMPYIRSFILGLNMSAQYLQWTTDEPPVSNFTLSPDKLECRYCANSCRTHLDEYGIILVFTAVITHTVSPIQQGKWDLYPSGGLKPGEGMALANEEVTILRLNITLLSLLFATSASVIMLGLALHTTRAFHGASPDNQAPVSNIGALQLLWLGYNSASVHKALQDVEDPTEDNLRQAGMMDICFASMTADEELPMRSLIDGLPVQAVDHDDGMSHLV
ncbi:hypothetical protein BD769DRAFT_1642821 [Suillus cothurnatus]|nr:hypothetical protein BD769DRAFT_1642821 [Suillus cothurnatus]